jgi:outer membrane lipoprotein-sorting protein
VTRSVALRALPALLVSASLLPRAAGAEPAPGSPEFPRHVMAKIDDLYRGQKSHGVIDMTVHTTHWTRTLSLESWSLGKDFSLVRILQPKKEQGTATLKAHHDLFTYLSNTGRTVKITAGMMGGSWMGSHFTNDDLVQVSRLSDDYDIKLVFDGDEGGARVYRFALVPKPNAPVVWGKVEVTVRASDLQPVRTVYFGEDGKAVRQMDSSDHKDVAGHRIPTRVVMRPLDGSGEYTQITWQKIDFNAAIDASFFSLQKLKAL